MRRLLYKTTLALSLLPFAMYGQTEVSQEPVTLSLEDAMKYAVKHNVNAKNARLDVKLQRAKNAEVTGIALPNLKAQGQYNDFLNPQKSFIPGEFFGMPGGFVPVQFTPKYGVTASGSASQILFDGSVMVALQARNGLMKLYEQSSQLTEEVVRYQIQNAYYGYVISKKQFDVLMMNMQNMHRIAYEMNEMYKAGFIEKIEADRINVQVNNLVTDSLKLSSLIAVTEQLLKYNMGMDIAQPIVLTDTAIDNKVAEAASMVLNTDADYNDRTEFGLLNTQLKLNLYNLKRHRLSGLPTLAAFATAGYNYSTNTFDDVFKFHQNYQFYSLWGLSVSMPLFDGMQRFNRVKQTKIQVAQVENSIENLKIGIDFQIASSKTNLKNALLSLQNQEANLKLAENVLDIANKKYKAGVGSNIEIIQAQTEYTTTQSKYFAALMDVVTAKSDLQKATGQFKK